MSWQPIETAPEEGVFLVWLAEPQLGSRVVPMKKRRRPQPTLVGGYFDFDSPKPTHWMPLPPPPQGEDDV